jgi:predicted Zn finger-like uncharacterized protein
MLITTCPHCETRFKVTTEQLLLRNGTVRCGACRQVFDGGARLVSDEAADLLLNPIAAQESEFTAATSESIPATDKTESNMQDELETLSKAITDWQVQPRKDLPKFDPLLDEYEEADSTPVVSIPTTTSTPASEPAFVQEAKQKVRRSRIWKTIFWLGIPVLLISLALQLVIHFRNEIVAQAPESDPAMRIACAYLGCTINLPAQIKQLSLQSSQLRAIPDQVNQFELIALLRNQSPSPQAWPSLELQLKDEIGDIITRKVFLPQNFLTQPNLVKQGITAQSEHEIRLVFELTGPAPTDFQLTMFYP